jgi:hypothetical protein
VSDLQQRRAASAVAILDAAVRDCDVRLEQARAAGDGPECALIGREHHMAAVLRRKIAAVLHVELPAPEGPPGRR